jgi:hypothetical protein
LARTKEGEHVTDHRIDVLNPAEALHDVWKPPAKKRTIAFQQRQRWQLAKLLGGIPEEHKPAVFLWVKQTLRTLEEYQQAHGNRSLPDMTFPFGEQILEATADMTFQLKDAKG